MKTTILLSLISLFLTFFTLTSAIPMAETLEKRDHSYNDWLTEQVNLCIGPFTKDQVRLRTDDLLLNTTLLDFDAIRHAAYPNEHAGSPSSALEIDWRSDACTGLPDSPAGFDFKPACHRNDFGYQNYHRQGRYTYCGKAKLDRLFRADLLSQCARHYADGNAGLVQEWCTIYADGYSTTSAFLGESAEGECTNYET